MIAAASPMMVRIGCIWPIWAAPTLRKWEAAGNWRALATEGPVLTAGIIDAARKAGMTDTETFDAYRARWIAEHGG
jgi:hypothetical protein